VQFKSAKPEKTQKIPNLRISFEVKFSAEFIKRVNFFNEADYVNIWSLENKNILMSNDQCETTKNLFGIIFWS
jgi:hypothetical protein